MPINFHDTTDAIHVVNLDITKSLDHLPAAIYSFQVTHSPTGTSYRMEKRGLRFNLPETRYGDHPAIVSQVVQTYDKVNPAFGVLAYGSKGAGKSLLCEDICNHLIQQGLPVLLIENMTDREDLRFAIAAVGPCVLYFDEFGKVYSTREGRESLLTLFSDPSITGVVYLATGNEQSEFSNYILNRPGRFRFAVDMTKLATEAASEYLTAHHVEPYKFMWLANISNILTYDILRCMVPALRNSTTYAEFNNAVRFLNIPKMNPLRVAIFAITYEGRRVERVIQAIFTSDAIEITAEVKDPETEETRLVNGRFPFVSANGFWSIEDRVWQYDQGLEVSFDLIRNGSAQSEALLDNAPIVRHIAPWGNDPQNIPNQPILPTFQQGDLRSRLKGENSPFTTYRFDYDL